MRGFFHRFRLNLGLKRVFVYHPVASKVLTLLKPGRLSLPVVDLGAFLGRPVPTIPYRYLAAPPMNTGPDDLVPLCALAAGSGARRIAEIGCNRGSGTINLALACPGARLVTYDIRPEAGDFIDAAEPELRGRIERRIVSFPLDAARLRAEPPYDFIYVDGDHTLAGVRADTELALERIAPGGLAVWHDYSDAGHEWVDGTNLVPEYLNELGRRLELRHLRGTALVVWRKAR